MRNHPRGLVRMAYPDNWGRRLTRLLVIASLVAAGDLVVGGVAATEGYAAHNLILGAFDAARLRTTRRVVLRRRIGLAACVMSGAKTLRLAHGPLNAKLPL
jgi:hypothetical protein